MKGIARLPAEINFSPGQFVMLCQQDVHPHYGRIGKILCQQFNRLIVELSHTTHGDGSEIVTRPLQDWTPVADIFVETYLAQPKTYGWRLRASGASSILNIGTPKHHEDQ
jgi:hypothetical protein